MLFASETCINYPLFDEGAYSAMTSITSLLDQLRFNRLEHLKTDRQTRRQRDAAMDQAVESAVEGADPGIRLVNGYRKKLRPAVATALAYIEELVSQIPGTVEVSRRSFTADPRVHAFFVTVQDLQSTFSHSSELREFIERCRDRGFSECCALLCMRKREKTVFGMEHAGEILRKDVRQTVVSFTDHQIHSPAESEAEARKGLKNCMFELLIRTTLERFVSHRTKQHEISRDRHQLNAKLKACDTERRAPGAGPNCIVTQAKEIDALRRRIADKRQALEDQRLDTPGDRLEHLREVFQHPERCVKLKPISLKLDGMGIKLREDSPHPGSRIDLAEVEVEDAAHRVVVLARFPHHDLQPHQHFLDRMTSHPGL